MTAAVIGTAVAAVVTAVLAFAFKRIDKRRKERKKAHVEKDSNSLRRRVLDRLYEREAQKHL